jgi:hypothetical protein
MDSFMILSLYPRHISDSKRDRTPETVRTRLREEKSLHLLGIELHFPIKYMKRADIPLDLSYFNLA